MEMALSGTGGSYPIGPDVRVQTSQRRRAHRRAAARGLRSALVISERLRTRTTKVGGAAAIAVEGELDLQTGPQFTEEVEVAVWGTAGAFVLDLSGLGFLDSSGLHALLRVRAYLAREDRTLVLVCPPGPARKVLDLAGVLDTFVVYSSPETAAAALVPADD
jgi:anti-anti-sigma factor